MKKRQYIILSFIFGIVFLIVWSLYSNYQDNAMKKQEKKDNSQYAKVITVENGDQRLIINGYGRVNPSLKINSSPEVPGVLMRGSYPLRQGVKFSKGSILYKIDDRESKLSLKARKASFLNLMANALADIKIDYPDSYEKWSEFYTKIDVEEDFPELPKSSSTQEKTFLASRNVLSEYYNIQKDEIRLAKYTIYAPFDGYFSQVMIQEGAFVGMGSPVAILSKTSDIEIEVPVDKENISLVSKGLEVKMKTRSTEEAWRGKVTRVEQQVNVNTQSVNVYITPSKADQELFPGMYLEVDILAGNIPESFELPRKALGNDNIVQVISDSTMHYAKVDVVKKNSNSYIVQGLSNGDLIITEQLPSLREGQRIIPIK